VSQFLWVKHADTVKVDKGIAHCECSMSDQGECEWRTSVGTDFGRPAGHSSVETTVERSEIQQ
jgi:hypothetical protein